jgi:hypothetical protein
MRSLACCKRCVLHVLMMLLLLALRCNVEHVAVAHERVCSQAALHVCLAKKKRVCRGGRSSFEKSMERLWGCGTGIGRFVYEPTLLQHCSNEFCGRGRACR